MTDLAVQLGSFFSFPGWTFMTVYRLIWVSVPLFSFCLRTAAPFQWFTSSSAFWKNGLVTLTCGFAVWVSQMFSSSFWSSNCCCSQCDAPHRIFSVLAESAELWRAPHCCPSITSTLCGGQFTSVTPKIYCIPLAGASLTAIQNPLQFLLLCASAVLELPLFLWVQN